MALHVAHLPEVAGAAAIGDLIEALAAARHEAVASDLVEGDLPDGAFDPLVHLAHLPAQAPRHAALDRPLPSVVADRLPGPLWSHQAQAIDLARAGRSVVVATGTASGKSLCYQAPIAEAVRAPVRPGTALIVFPTKALAHDQLRALTALEVPGLAAGAYDGDASPEERTWIRTRANVVLTNPEMLHAGILPHHERWSTFLGRLRYVVVDELHTFRGIFGSHVAQVLRRLRRLALHHGAQPSFVTCSATIGEPAGLAEALTGVPAEAVTDDGSPRGPRTVALWQPPLLDVVTGARASAHRETAVVASGLIEAGHTTLAFTRSRRSTELVAADVRRRLPRPLAPRIRAYRGGYLPEERRAIEDDLFGGRLAGIVATTALELGIDVGGLGAVVLDGFPGTMASFWQQAGRAGRRGDPAAVVLVAGADQLDQWLVRHPHELLRRRPEPAVVNPANPYVLDPHLRCAAHELPLTHADQRFWPGALDDGIRRLVQDDQLVVRRRGRRQEPMAVWDGVGWPSHHVGLRSAAGAPVRIVAAGDGRRIGDVDRARAPEQVHPGASYLHQGEHWQVRRLDLDAGVAEVEPHDGLTYTVARRDTRTRLLEPDEARTVGRLSVVLGGIEVESQVVGFQRREVGSGKLVASERLELPSSRLRTRGVWYLVAPEVVAAAELSAEVLPSALHAAEHAAIGMLPLFAICDRWDVGGISVAAHPDTALPTIVVYDAVPGGAGVAELAFASAEGHLRATLESVESCRCADGCPSCVQSPKCGNGNEHLDKAAAVRFLRAALC